MARSTPDPPSDRYDDALFQALMRLDTPALVHHVRTARRDDLPAPVLARAYRELLAQGRNEAAEAAIERLFGGELGDPPSGVGKPEYMGWLLRTAAKHSTNWQEALDLYQAALGKIARALVRTQGANAHTAWKAFCYQRLIDAKRERDGRRGERVEPPHVSLESEDSINPVERALGFSFQGSVAPDREEEMMGFLQACMERVEDPLVREVGLAQFFNGPPVPISGRDPYGLGLKPLTERLGLTLDQVNRLKRKARDVLRDGWNEWNEKDWRP
ncbi:MAG TPA: hypothetical protein VGR37_20530 [Longimicrobiaceae bacterium]|nr:hypothetical protein [Longimicrobiaceae bacterium]